MNLKFEGNQVTSFFKLNHCLFISWFTIIIFNQIYFEVLLECIVAMIQHLFIHLFIDSNHIEIDLIVFKTRFLNRARQLNIASQCSPNLCPKSNPYKNDIYLFI